MKKIAVDELVEYKILPFNIYNENGDIIFGAGDNLTPGKLLQLRYIAKLYCDEDEINVKQKKAESTSDDESEFDFPLPKEKMILDQEADSLDEAINYNSSIDYQSQLQMKAVYKKAYNALNNKIDGESIKQIKNIRDKIIDNFLPLIAKTYKKSQLKIVGDYERYHGLNVALLAVMLAKKMNYNDTQLSDITLAALLHDIGKTRLPKESSYSSSASQTNKVYELHPELGYKILKNEMRLAEDICVVALEHHEKNDGTGYPYGVSSDLIHPYSQIISICNMYDNLISGKAHIIVTTPQDAVKKIMEMGSSWFSPEVLYSFVYMTNYHDDTPLDELLKTGNANWE